MELRTVKKLSDQSMDIWTEIEFSELKKGFIFRMYENTGEEVIGDHESVYFFATSDAYLNKDEVLMVDVEYLEKTKDGKYVFVGD